MTLSWWDQAVLLTLAYVDQFHYPLTQPEIEQRLVKPRPQYWLSVKSARWRVPAEGSLPPEVELDRVEGKGGRRTAVRRQLTTTLRRLRAAGLLHRTRSWYSLAGSPDLAAYRQKRSRWSQAKWREVSELVRLVRWVPWIKGIAVTGSLAMNNVVENDDCDFLIVTQPRRLWLTRLAVIAVALLKGKRRSWSGEEQDSWCFNMWLDAEHLSMPEELHQVYGAYEVIQARWVEDRNNIEQLFRGQNAWVETILPFAPAVSAPGAQERQRSTLQQNHASASHHHRTWLEKWGDGWDWLAFQLQLWYMKSHMTRERVGRGYAFFHPRDTKRDVTHQWRRRLKSLLENA